MVHRRRHRLAGQQGLSLIEAMFAALLLLIVSLAVLPFFARAGSNNIAGFDASQAVQHARTGIESLGVQDLESPTFSFVAPIAGATVRPATVGVGGDELALPDAFWDERRLTPGTAPPRLGDGGWVATAAGARGTVYWRRSEIIRSYCFADIAEGVVDSSDESTLATLGHPHLFDRALESDAKLSYNHFRELDVELRSQRSGGETTRAIGNQHDRTVRIF